MSLADGMAALRLEMPGRVPRTEYSAGSHWELIKAVTGIDVHYQSTAEVKGEAYRAFIKAWNYDFHWCTNIANPHLGDYYTDMGHAVYEAGGTDYRSAKESYFKCEEDVLGFDALEKLGKKDHAESVRYFNEEYDHNCANNPDGVNMVGVYITCISGLIDLFGWDLLLATAGMDAEGFGQVTNRYAQWILQYFEALAESKSEVVMVHDDIVWTSGAFLHPDWYRTYIFPNYKKYFAPLREAKKIIMFTSDGTYTEFIDDIAACGVNGFVMEPTTDMKYIAEKYGKTHAFIGNADTRILLEGSKEDIENEVKRCMDIGKKCPGFFMAVGNHIPSNTPVENALWYNDCYEKMSKR